MADYIDVLKLSRNWSALVIHSANISESALSRDDSPDPANVTRLKPFPWRKQNRQMYTIVNRNYMGSLSYSVLRNLSLVNCDSLAPDWSSRNFGQLQGTIINCSHWKWSHRFRWLINKWISKIYNKLIIFSSNKQWWCFEINFK